MTYIAYLLPKHDYHLALEDGLGYIEMGETKEEALTKLTNSVRGTPQNDPLTDEELADIFEDCALHIQKI